MASAAEAPPLAPVSLHEHAPGVVVPWSAPYAGFWRRFVAVVLDGLILTFVTSPIQWFIRPPMFGWLNSDNVSFDQVMAALGALMGWFVLGATCNWLYFSLFESSKLQGTLGKAALNIRVTDSEGKRISFGRATGRYFAKLLSGALFLIGYLIQPFTKRRQALHDLIAATLVVRRDPAG
jgi:uncharacterized RDD family membrane protein YckC